MNIDNINFYFALATILTPAIIMIIIRRCVKPFAFKRFSIDWLNLIIYSTLNIVVYTIISNIFFRCPVPLTYLLHMDALNNFLGSYITFTGILPLLLGCWVAFADKNLWLNKILNRLFDMYTETNIPTQWEEVFSKAPHCDITVKLNNGDIIKGNFAGMSGASSDTNNKDIFIDNISHISGAKYNPKSTAIWISGKDILYIIFNDMQCYNK